MYQGESQWFCQNHATNRHQNQSYPKQREYYNGKNHRHVSQQPQHCIDEQQLQLVRSQMQDAFASQLEMSSSLSTKHSFLISGSVICSTFVLSILCIGSSFFQLFMLTSNTMKDSHDAVIMSMLVEGISLERGSNQTALGSLARINFSGHPMQFNPIHQTNNTEQLHVTTNDESDSNRTSRQSAGGAFIHIGKACGSSLSILLRNGCHSFVPKPCRTIPAEEESAASRMVSSYYHVPDFKRLNDTYRSPYHDFYILTVRDPFDRTVSAFTYEHILNRNARGETFKVALQRKYEQAFVCFPSLQHFVDFLGVNSTDYSYPYQPQVINSSSCRDLARAAIHGDVAIYDHLYYGYDKILKYLNSSNKTHGMKYQTSPLYSARQDYLWDDWKTINVRFLNQTNSVYIPSATSYSSTRKNITAIAALHNKSREDFEPVSRKVTSKGTSNLCRALHSEYRAYFWFLRNSKNLNSKDVDDAKNKAIMNCPDLKLFLETMSNKDDDM